MSSYRSTLRKVRESISKYGLRKGLEDSIARWAARELITPTDICGDYDWILNQCQTEELPAPSSGPLRINWFVPSVTGGAGGLFNVFRTVRQLEQWGHQQRIYIAEDRSVPSSAARDFVRKFFFPIDSEVKQFDGSMSDSDATVATSWATAYTVRSVRNTARKFYFVQDLEHLFYPEGSILEFARQTYTWNYYGITAGTWISNVLRTQYGMNCSAFGFSYDREMYSRNGKRRFSDGKTRVLFYARPSTARRGFEMGILALSLVAKAFPHIEFIVVGVSRKGIKLPFPAVFLDRMPAKDLPALYRSCEVALVLSHTNLSLLPMELMACGCAVVSNSGPNVEWLLDNNCAQLAAPNPESLAKAMLALLRDEELRARRVAAGFALAEATNWVEEIKKIEAAFYRGLLVSPLNT